MWLWTVLAAAAPTSAGPVLAEQVNAAMTRLKSEDEAPHYISAALTSVEEWRLTSEHGVIASQDHDRQRALDVDVRVGTPELDSTHQLRGFSSLDGDDRQSRFVPLDDGFPLAHAVWRELDARYRDAAERMVVVRANRNVKVAEEAPANDFEPREPVVAKKDHPTLELDLEAWKPVLRRASAALEADPRIISSLASLSGEQLLTTFVDTEGTSLEHGRTRVRIALLATTVADDGDEVRIYRSLDVHDPERLPKAGDYLSWANDVRDEVLRMADAPRGEPYSGPVILTGRASGVFFHEVMGHRVEGHRQKRDDEGRTFADHVGKPVLPDFIDVYDDPTISELEGVQLNGHYAYDDEGVAAARAELVDDGIFKGFLQGRSPIEGFENSNGHGRRSFGNAPTPRMGNTIIEASKTVSSEKLKSMLRAEAKKQGLEYGYLVDDIEGGFTMTGRVTPNAFNVRAATTWRIYADGRPDEPIRGIDLVGTPFVAFSNLLAASDERDVFNGVCGAESGWVPVSAVAPSLLFEKLEFQLKEKGQDRPPLLPRPGEKTDGAADGGAQ